MMEFHEEIWGGEGGNQRKEWCMDPTYTPTIYPLAPPPLALPRTRPLLAFPRTRPLPSPPPHKILLKIT
jgi:hypothetical protein